MKVLIFLIVYFAVFITVDLCTFLKDIKKISAELTGLYPSADKSQIVSEARFEARLLPRITLSLFSGFAVSFFMLTLIYIFNSHAERLFGFLSSHRLIAVSAYIIAHILAIIVYIFLHHESASEERVCHNIKRGAFVIAGIFTSFMAAANLF